MYHERLGLLPNRMGEPLTSYGAQGSQLRHRGQLPEFAAGDRTERQQTRHPSIAADRFARGLVSMPRPSGSGRISP